MKKKPRFIKHKCHEVGHQYDRCLTALHSVYISKVQDFAASRQSFHFRPHRNGKFQYEEARRFMQKLCSKANFPQVLDCSSTMVKKS